MSFVQVKKCLTEPKQVVKLVFLVVCVCLTIYQLSECVRKIAHPPVSSYYKFHVNETIKYPSLTICRKPAYNRKLFKEYGLEEKTANLMDVGTFANFPFNNTSIENFLNKTTYSFKKTVPMYGFKGAGYGKNIEFRSFYLVTHGLCHNIIPQQNSDVFSIAGGFFFYLAHTDKNKTRDTYGLSTSGFEIYIHQENEVFTEEQAGEHMEYLYVETSEELLVTLSLQTQSRISTPEEPCVSDPDYSKAKCQEKCIHNFVAREAGCTLPYLRNLDAVYPVCSDYASVSSFFEAYSSEVKKKKQLRLCNCQSPCNSTVYTYQIESRREAGKVMGPSSTVSLYFATNLITSLCEVISYDWNVFLADVGGSLGFLLGLSVIGFINVIEEAINLIFTTKNEKQTDEGKNTQDEISVDEQDLKSVMEYMVNFEMREHENEQKKQDGMMKY